MAAFSACNQIEESNSKKELARGVVPMLMEPILIVDDAAVHLRLAQLLLSRAGYEVRTANNAESALRMLETYRPKLILTDICLPGMTGLQMVRRIRKDPSIGRIPVIAISAKDTNGDYETALSSGCDGYIAKPLDSRTFLPSIREFLDRQAPSDEPLDLSAMGLSSRDLECLRRDFLREGLAQSQEILQSLSNGLDREHASSRLQQWAADGGVLGYPEISRVSSQLEDSLKEDDIDTPSLREGLTDLTLAFRNLLERQRPQATSCESSHALANKKVALVAFPPDQEEDVCQLLESVEARPCVFSATDNPESQAVRECSLLLVHLCAKTRGTAWLRRPSEEAASPNMTVIAGRREELEVLDTETSSVAADYVATPWQADDVLLRLAFVVGRQRKFRLVEKPKTEKPTQRRSASPKVLLADDDPIIRKVAETVLRNHNVACRLVTTGDEALHYIREELPNVAILDVGMPGLDGYQVLEAIRSEGLPVPVILLTARQQESDILKGFRLGADDYVTKPFKPSELIARLNRLLRK